MTKAREAIPAPAPRKGTVICDAFSIRRPTRRSSSKALSSLSFTAGLTRLGHNATIGIKARRLCRLIWKILHQGVRYEEGGPVVARSLSNTARKE
jgi:hypothetical protein